MMDVIGRATNHFEQGLAEKVVAGGQHIGYQTVVPMFREIGEGYTKDSAQRFTSSTATVYFNEFGQVISAFPKKP